MSTNNTDLHTTLDAFPEEHRRCDDLEAG